MQMGSLEPQEHIFLTNSQIEDALKLVFILHSKLKD